MSTPSMPEPYATIQTAMITRLAAQGITAYDHQPIELYGTPSAYLVVADTTPDYERADQGDLLIGKVDYKVRYFVSLEGSEAVATAQALSGKKAILAAFAGGTLGGAVKSASIDRIAMDPVEMGRDRRPMLLVEADVQIRPTRY